jgi:hypothetical protein
MEPKEFSDICFSPFGPTGGRGKEEGLCILEEISTAGHGDVAARPTGALQAGAAAAGGGCFGTEKAFPVFCAE